MLLPKVPPLAGLRAGHSRALGQEMLVTGTSQVSQVLPGSNQPCGSPREGFLQRPPAGRGALGESPGPLEPRVRAVPFELPPCRHVVYILPPAHLCCQYPELLFYRTLWTQIMGTLCTQIF